MVIEFVTHGIECEFCKDRVAMVLVRGFSLAQASMLFGPTESQAGAVEAGHQMLRASCGAKFPLCCAPRKAS